MLQDDLGIDGFEGGEIGDSASASGRVSVGREFLGPKEDLQARVEEQAANRGWTNISVGCGTDGSGFVLHGNRMVGERVASLNVTASLRDDQSTVYVEVAAELQEVNRFPRPPEGPPEQCQ